MELNGKLYQEACTIRELLEKHQLEASKVVVEVNGLIVNKNRFMEKSVSGKSVGGVGAFPKPGGEFFEKDFPFR